MRPHPSWRAVFLLGLLTGTAVLPLVAAGLPVPAALPSTVLQVDATSALSFTPSTLSVTPGQLVELEVTQLANFNHTFVLSSVANETIPVSDSTAQLDAFFNAHPPIVNLSLGEVVGTTTFANFTAPPIGTYEFVCQIPGHFQSGMHGVLDSGTGGSSSSGLSSTTLLALAAIVIVVVVVIAAVAVRRRAPKTPGSA